MHYYSLSQYLNDTYGCKVYKLALAGGTTCPNRDGTCGDKGCIFCSAKGAGNFASDNIGTLYEQIETAKLKIKAKTSADKFIAYFQSFSSTYLPLDVLENKLLAAIRHPDVIAVSVATRPDCLPDKVLDLLENLNKIKPIWVELGLQTIHETSAEYIRRGYKLECFEKALTELKKRNITTIVHMIIGLPNETDSMILETAKYIGKSGASGIKFHLLHVLKDTDLEKDYKAQKFKALELNHYAEILAECIKLLPKNLVVHRLTGDGDKRELVAPLWSGDKKHVLNYINSYFDEINLVQGQNL